MANVPFIVLSNSGGTGTANTGAGNASYPGAGVTKAVYRSIHDVKIDSTHTAQTLYPIAAFTRTGGVIKSVTASWTEVNAANTTLATVNVLKCTEAGATAGTTILATVGTLTNNATTQTRSTVSSAYVPTLSTGSANVNPILVTTASLINVTKGDALFLTTTATSTQGTDLIVSVEVEWNLNDEVASPNLI